MKQARDYRKYNIRLTSADWQRGSGRVINNTHMPCVMGSGSSQTARQYKYPGLTITDISDFTRRYLVTKYPCVSPVRQKVYYQIIGQLSGQKTKQLYPV